MKKSAFNLIELMVVIGITALMAALTIPSYINFNKTQEVKQSALKVKSLLRDAQNRSFSGEKDTTICGTNTLQGFYAQLSADSSSITIAGKCGSLDFSSQTISLGSNVTVSGFFKQDCSTVQSATNGLSVLFKPIGKGTFFIDGKLSNNATAELPITKLIIKFKNSENSDFYLSLTNTGEINDFSACN